MHRRLLLRRSCLVCSKLLDLSYVKAVLIEKFLLIINISVHLNVLCLHIILI